MQGLKLISNPSITNFLILDTYIHTYIYMYVQGSPRKSESIVGGHGLGGVCNHMNHFGHHIKEIQILKARGEEDAERALREHRCMTMFVSSS
jgi:hypothetical protein